MTETAVYKRIGEIVSGIVPEPDPTPEELAQRWPTCPPTACWSHSSKPRADGYRQVWFQGRERILHRLLYDEMRVPVPHDMDAEHLCRNRGCCNPAHIEVTTPRVNILRGESPCAVNARRTHCAHGHPLEGENLYLPPDGKRRCRECIRQAGRAWRERNPEYFARRQRLLRQGPPEPKEEV